LIDHHNNTIVYHHYNRMYNGHYSLNQND
jgi:hypothetical protein